MVTVFKEKLVFTHILCWLCILNYKKVYLCGSDKNQQLILIFRVVDIYL